MQFTVERDAFLTTLASVTGVIEKRTTIPILSNVRIDAGAKAVMLRATDLDMQIEAPCMADVARPGALTVDGPFIRDAVKRMGQGGTISVTLNELDHRLTLSAGRLRYVMLTLPAEDHPTIDIPAAAGVRAFIMDAASLRGLLDPVRFAMSTEEVRFFLCGVFLHQIAEQLVAVATDGHRLSCVRQPLPAGAGGMPGVILPRKFIAELLRVLPKDGEVALEVCENRVAATSGELRIVSKLIQGTYPDYERVIPAPADHIVADRKRLLMALDRVCLANDGDKAIGMVVTTGALRLVGGGRERGRAEDEMDVDAPGRPATIGVNGSYMRAALEAIDVGRVVIRYSGDGDPMLIYAEGDEAQAHRMVVMPMRVAQDMERIAA